MIHFLISTGERSYRREIFPPGSNLTTAHFRVCHWYGNHDLQICKLLCLLWNCEGHGDTERNARELGPSWLRSASFPRWVSLQRLFILLMLSWMLIAGKWQKASWSGSMSRPHLFISGTCLLPQPWLLQVFKFPLCPLMDLLSMIYWQTIPTKGHPWFILRYSLADHKDRRRTDHSLCVFQDRKAKSMSNESLVSLPISLLIQT